MSLPFRLFYIYLKESMRQFYIMFIVYLFNYLSFQINNFELMNLPLLKEFRINNNVLNMIHPMAFMNVPHLQYLYMRDNLIGNLDGNRLQAFKQLEILDVANNMLQKLPELKDLTNLKQVRLDGNLIEKVETLAFSNNPKLQLISMQQLNLRNNSLKVIDSNAFASLKQLTTLDLAQNQIEKIAKVLLLSLISAFSQQSKMFWLDISNNQLTSFEEGTFDKKIANILLDGNRLMCDESFDWFVRYLVTNRVRTFLPFQPEITCSGPEKYSGVRGIIGMGDYLSHLLLISNVINFQAIPSLRNIPGLNVSSNMNTGVGAQPVPMNRNFNSAIEQFTAPLVRFATGGQPVASDIEQLIQSIPNFIVNVPGLGNVDISKLDPNLVAHVLKGGQIPGIPRETLDSIVQQYMVKMHEAAAAAQAGVFAEDSHKYLPPIDKLPHEMVTNVLQGEPLPGLNETQTQVIKEYYTQLVPLTTRDINESNTASPGFSISTQVLDMMKLLPEGYNFSRIPVEMIASISRGELPDMRNLPSDLLEHLRMNTDKLGSIFNKATSGNATIEEVIAKLPKFNKPDLATFSPYDINRLSNDMIHEEEEAKKAAKLRVYTAIALGLVGAVTVVVLAVFVIYIKRQQREGKERRSLVEGRQPLPGAPLANSTMRGETQIHPTRSSQLHLRDVICAEFCK
uniref:LRRCT domain-containing protein n=1 Tax=Heterorhabditis bacteriophora TaxID=37862 RepID=A0A1I7WTG8_HETBA